MTPIQQFRLGTLVHEKQTASLLDAAGTTLGNVPGTVLQAQFDVTGGYLLITADEDPFEGYLHISLLDRQFTRVDAVGMGLPYRSGAFRSRGTGPGDRLRFSFFGDEVWLLDVTPKAHWTAVRPLGPSRYASPFPGRHRLILSRA